METTILKAEIKNSDLHIIESLLKRLKAKNISFEKVEDDTKMSKKEFFAKIDRARAGKKHRISMEEMQKMLLQ
ncbi:hypothetical protein [Capnocytophaga stomatis]|uniref:hypothetical protein n=1 Tax=Capnocytophaga stomatis TaxID=1848904 RepID=UPI00194F8F93|nr:hypothetical protein [Capnocytophaga stomatis]